MMTSTILGAGREQQPELTTFFPYINLKSFMKKVLKLPMVSFILLFIVH